MQHADIRHIAKCFLNILAVILVCLIGAHFPVSASNVIQVDHEAAGLKMGDRFEVLYDDNASMGLEDVEQAYAEGRFQPLQSRGSTGLQAGTIWSHFYVQNTSDKAVTVHLEYIDHQVITLQAFSKPLGGSESFRQIADLSLHRPFSHRPIPHPRFVFEVPLEGQQTQALFVRFSSDGAGFVFPEMRIWTPRNLQATQAYEASGIGFLVGGFMLMSVIALVGGVATSERFFYTYAIYALSKIAIWATMLGYTHQLLVTDSFHWSYISMAGAAVIFSGILFTRGFLNTARYTPRLDIALKIMLVNAVVLFVCAIFQSYTLSVVSITLALLLYPSVLFAGLIRWYQGSRAAALFSVAWGFLVAGLVVQALRDLGFVEHNFFNYYWPPVASFTEMVVIMVAIGLKVRHLRSLKEHAERKYLHQLEKSKTLLEQQVQQRTEDLQQAKLRAEHEARTDALTGARNRRSFFTDSERILKQDNDQPDSFSLLMFDIDNFKKINDNHGHAVGDEALKAFAKLVAINIRDCDVFGRLGGEEFCLLVKDTRENALSLAERLREAISQISIESEQGQFSFTTSIGVAHLVDESVLEDMLGHADRALYRAKRLGRNQVVECDGTEEGCGQFPPPPKSS